MAQLQAVISRLSIGLFSNSRQDSEITKQVRDLNKLHGLKPGKWIKYKLPEEALDPVRKVASDARTEHYRLTLPWEEGYGLLPLPARQQYEAAMAARKEAFENAVEAFKENYPDWVEQAKTMHNGTFNASDYPPQSEVPSCFKWELVIYPLPQSSHFDSALRGLYGQALEDATARRVEEAVKSTWDRLLGPVDRIAQKLADPEAVFRDSLIENVREIVDLIPVLNLTGNAQLVQAANSIKERFTRLNPETLRVNKVMRKSAADAAKAMLNQFGAFGSRKFA
jgi:hypothetical protein